MTKLKNHILRHRLWLAPAALMVLTAFLTFFKIGQQGEGNEYYTAAVQSMLTSWHNFFFISFDPAGFISVDKPALGLWLQCLSALVFGVHGWSVILPETICSAISVAVLYQFVKRRFGFAASLLSGLFLALSPIFIAVGRTNNLDSSLVMVCLLALWALDAAAERGSLKLLLLSAALVGLAFNIKMLQAFLIVPAMAAAYLFTAGISLKKRLAHLCAALAVLMAVSFCWVAAVDLTPVQDRPYVGSSTGNSALELALYYNGLDRVFSDNMSGAANAQSAGDFEPGSGGRPAVIAPAADNAPDSAPPDGAGTAEAPFKAGERPVGSVNPGADGAGGSLSPGMSAGGLREGGEKSFFAFVQQQYGRADLVAYPLGAVWASLSAPQAV